jgi:hypothetical protein
VALPGGHRRIGTAASGWFDITTTRTYRHYGAGATTEILVNLLGASIAAKVVSDLIDYAKAKLRERSLLVDHQVIDDDHHSVDQIGREIPTSPRSTPTESPHSPIRASLQRRGDSSTATS